jgi:hypothetical protein|eukprot:scaffold15400_cov303-Alexandrium_tamarense.AAC.3
MSGPVMAKGDRESPLRRQASAAAVAIGPGMPLTMMRRAEESNDASELIWSEVDEEDDVEEHDCELVDRRAKALVD